jgi:predicted GNAT family N-acyltransferase
MPSAELTGEITVKVVETEAELEAAIGVRFRVFVEEQSVPPEEELDEYDAAATHAVALHDGTVVGTGRVILGEGPARIGRMAVDQPWRRNGVGGLLLTFLEEEARSQGATGFVLHAQEYVKSFYAAHGYQEHGEVFLEAGIRHVEMRKGS